MYLPFEPMKITRRSFLNSMLLANVSAFAGNSHALARKANKSKTTTKEEWMAQVLKQTRRRRVPGVNPPRGGPAFYSTSRLLLGRFRDPWYYLIEPISWIPNPGQVNFEKVRVPRGFVTDLASIPPIFYPWLRPDGEYAYAAIVHDYLYWTQTRTRLMSDEILKSSMEDYRVDKRKIRAIYNAVRAFGESAWNENARLKADGERRILQRFPRTSLINWTDWKQRSDVFSD
jgi:hypothetical protein